MFQPWTKADFLALWRSFFPDDFVVPLEIENGGFGTIPYASQAAIFERLSEALNVTTQAYYLRDHSSKTGDYSRGEARATGELQVSRVGYAGGDIVIVEGTEFVADVVTPSGRILDGELFRATSEATIAAGTLGPVTVAIEAVRAGWQGNVPAGSIARFKLLGRASVPNPSIVSATDATDSGVPDRFTLAMVGQYARIVGGANGGPVAVQIVNVSPGDPTSTASFDAAFTFPDSPTRIDVLEFEDLGLRVEQAAATTGGRHGFLDQIARDRGTGRAIAESDDQLRARLVELADVVSLGAITRIASRILSPLGLAYRIHEAGIRVGGLGGFVLDLDPLDWGSACDDGRVPLSESNAVRYFVICVEIGNEGEFGLALDADPAPPGAPNALDWAFLDGYPVGYLAALAVLWRAIEAARAAGIAWRLIRDPDLP